MLKNRKDGFTLLEMLTVLGILGLMMATAFTGLSHAQRQGRIAKAQTEVRQIVSAWFAYEAANDDWPANMPEDGAPVDADYTTLGELLGRGGENRVYLNAQLQNGKFLDPWGRPYRLKITRQADVPDISDTFSAAITFPNRNRPPTW